MGLEQIIAVALAGLSLVATLGIAALAMHFSSDFNKLRVDISELDAKFIKGLETEKKFAFQSDMLLQLANNIYRSSYTSLNFFSQDEVSRDKNRLIFAELQSGLVTDLAETIELYRVLVELSAENINTLIDRKPTKKTLVFLIRLIDVCPPELESHLKDSVEHLTGRLIGYDSSKWTGRRAIRHR